MAAAVETLTTIDTIQPNSRNMMPERPDTNVSGRNTATVTSVVAITDSTTSLVA